MQVKYYQKLQQGFATMAKPNAADPHHKALLNSGEQRCENASVCKITVIASHRVGAKRRPMTGFAKQSISPRKERMDCFAKPVIGCAFARPVGSQ